MEAVHAALPEAPIEAEDGESFNQQIGQRCPQDPPDRCPSTGTVSQRDAEQLTRCSADLSPFVRKS
jgi:hypothetical protein